MSRYGMCNHTCTQLLQLGIDHLSICVGLLWLHNLNTFLLFGNVEKRTGLRTDPCVTFSTEMVLACGMKSTSHC